MKLFCLGVQNFIDPSLWPDTIREPYGKESIDNHEEYPENDLVQRLFSTFQSFIFLSEDPVMRELSRWEYPLQLIRSECPLKLLINFMFSILHTLMVLSTYHPIKFWLSVLKVSVQIAFPKFFKLLTSLPCQGSHTLTVPLEDPVTREVPLKL